MIAALHYAWLRSNSSLCAVGAAAAHKLTLSQHPRPYTRVQNDFYVLATEPGTGSFGCWPAVRVVGQAGCNTAPTPTVTAVSDVINVCSTGQACAPDALPPVATRERPFKVMPPLLIRGGRPLSSRGVPTQRSVSPSSGAHASCNNAGGTMAP
jgi:hypothetical protein